MIPSLVHLLLIILMGYFLDAFILQWRRFKHDSPRNVVVRNAFRPIFNRLDILWFCKGLNTEGVLLLEFLDVGLEFFGPV